MNILFLCTGNSCRSILAEATFNHLAPVEFHATSAGSQPTGEVHPRALTLLEQEGIANSGLSSKSWFDVPVPDIVITVCGHAESVTESSAKKAAKNTVEETCPIYLLGHHSEILRTHWGVADPAYITGTEAEVTQAFKQAYCILRQRIEMFFALPLNELAQNKLALQQALHVIAEHPITELSCSK